MIVFNLRKRSNQILLYYLFCYFILITNFVIISLLIKNRGKKSAKHFHQSWNITWQSVSYVGLLNKSKADNLVPCPSFQADNLPELMSLHVSPAISKLNFSDNPSAEYFSLWIFLSHITWKWSLFPQRVGILFWSSSSCGCLHHSNFPKLLYEFRLLLNPLSLPPNKGTVLSSKNCPVLFFNCPTSLSHNLEKQSLDLCHWQVTSSPLKMVCAKP